MEPCTYLYGRILGGIPIMLVFYAIFYENWWFRTKRFTGLWELVQLLWTIPIREIFHFHHLPKLYFGFNPKNFARLLCNAQSSRRDTLWLFSFKFPAHFDTKFVTPGVWFWSYVTFCTCTSDRKWLQNVILCTKSMQIEFFHIVHINMLIFTLNGWNEFVLALLCFKKCLPQISPKKTTKTKGQKTKIYIRNS